MENIYSNLHRKYAVSKTLRFELKPIGKTKKNIEKNGLLEEDEYRDAIYKNVKKYCDEVHKYFIDNCMENFSLDIELLEKYQKLQLKEVNTSEDRKEIKDIQEKLRKSIANRFKKDAYYKSLFNKDMIIKNLPEIYKNEDDKLKEISEFNKFTTYFRGFNQNRENMYVEDEKSTAIAYRLINENLPIFVNNVKVFEKIKEVLSAELEMVNKELNEYIQINANDISEIFSLAYFNDILTQRGIEIYNIIVSGKSEENTKKIKGLNEYINEYNQTHKENKIPKLRQLYKQILSDRVGASFVFDIIDSDKKLVKNIQAYYMNFRNIMYKENGIKYLIERKIKKICKTIEKNIEKCFNNIIGNT